MLQFPQLSQIDDVQLFAVLLAFGYPQDHGHLVAAAANLKKIRQLRWKAVMGGPNIRMFGSPTRQPQE